jgi:hypothetical protein
MSFETLRLVVPDAFDWRRKRFFTAHRPLFEFVNGRAMRLNRCDENELFLG